MAKPSRLIYADNFSNQKTWRMSKPADLERGKFYEARVYSTDPATSDIRPIYVDTGKAYGKLGMTPETTIALLPGLGDNEHLVVAETKNSKDKRIEKSKIERNGLDKKRRLEGAFD